MGARVTDLWTEEFHGEQGNVVIHDEVTIETLAYWLQRGLPFAFSHYGDGEMQAIAGMPGGSGASLIDSYRYTPALVRALRKTVRHPHEWLPPLVGKPYLYGISPAAFRLSAKGAAEKAIEMYAPRVQWRDGQIIARASARGELHDFIEAMADYTIIYVGPAHVQTALDGVVTLEEFIEVPLCDAHERCADIADRIADAIGDGVHDKLLVGFSAGALSNIAMYDLWQRYNQRITLIDFGSIWDPYAGLMTRSYFKAVDDWPAVIHKNLYGN